MITEIINGGGLAGIWIVTCRQRGGQTEFWMDGWTDRQTDILAGR